MARKPEAQLKLELINVGHGDALVLHWLPKSGKPSTVLVDGGPAGGEKRVHDTLGRLGASEIDLAVLTHCDADHVDGLLAYVETKGALPVRHYWGPCVPAFRRHQWLFAPRVARGIDKTEALQRALSPSCNISWPVEGASWTSSDGGLSIRVISPAGRLIERLLVGSDSLSLFLEQPMPIGWLLGGTEDEQDEEDPFSDLRLAISTGEITPDKMPLLPPMQRPAPPEQLTREAATKGVEPEFFGNSVLNDTSIVLLAEARIGVVTRRFLFTGDLENFTYLMAQHPMGLGCDIVKVPHHGSRSYVDRDVAYDAVWQWMRPRAALVSANGKHHLPRSEFRDAALRYGTTLFCTSRRSREIVSGVTSEPCCQIQYACNKQEPVSLTVSAMGIEADGIACARGNLSGVMPVIEVRQHVVEPSPILSTLGETEIRKHMDWAVGWLRETLTQRQARSADADLTPISLKVMSQAAAAARRVAASTEIETILERAARAGKVWLSPRRRRGDERSVWIMPRNDEINEFKAWIDRFAVIQLAIMEGHTAAAPEELLYAANTEWIARRFAAQFAFPREMFEGALWPILVDHLLKTRSICERNIPDATYRSHEASKLLTLFKEADIYAAFTALVERLSSISNSKALAEYILAASGAGIGYGKPSLSWPEEFAVSVTPLWLGRVLPPSGLIGERYQEPFSFAGQFDGADKVQEWISLLLANLATSLPDRLIRPALAALILSGFDVISRPKHTVTRTPK
ncbi:ComEC/Rec2 family competence protein [Rhizobium sophoriradicis]|uniref:MBL fold metallo-hydrolase n=1 Tax=Rhizobium sophoriradicis TaxID=1535245 RepID=A0A2A5KNH7_9HYPH|nr:hypothetical protein [Rhizobium sophoriradicis]PCK78491.1 hypothetical protein CPT34_24775 [Rhizobium sophoriradicis]